MNNVYEPCYDQSMNLIIINGSEPNKKAPNYEFIARTLFEKLEENTTINGCIMIPDSQGYLTSWRPNDAGNVWLQISAPLVLHGPDPLPNELPKKFVAENQMQTDRVITMQNEKDAVMIEAEEIAQEAEEILRKKLKFK